MNKITKEDIEFLESLMRLDQNMTQPGVLKHCILIKKLASAVKELQDKLELCEKKENES